MQSTKFFFKCAGCEANTEVSENRLLEHLSCSGFHGLRMRFEVCQMLENKRVESVTLSFDPICPSCARLDEGRRVKMVLSFTQPKDDPQPHPELRLTR